MNNTMRPSLPVSAMTVGFGFLWGRSRRRCLALVLCFPGLLPSAFAASPAVVSFDRDVMPLLERRCNQCHHGEQQSGGLDLTRLATIRRGGDELGAAVIPGDPDASPLIGVLTGDLEPAMPEEGESLPTEEINLLRDWIAAGAEDDSPAFPADEVRFFEREIRPVLANHCFKCHAGEDPEHGLRLTSRHAILAGGFDGPVVDIEHPRESRLMKAVLHKGEVRMPRGGDRLSEKQVAALERWVSLGLPWPADQNVLAREKLFTISDADRNHWAFRPLPGKIAEDGTIDAILAQHHQGLGVTSSPQADRHQLLRRVTFDLIGYPPTPEEIAAFTEDSRDDSFEQVVDSLLASPLFGWRWGRHWLDYTRNGSTGQPTRGPALDADRYQRWVAQCFNEDRPYDWFVRTHLAGDWMPGYEGEDYCIDQASAAAVPINGPRTFSKAETETFILMDKLDESVEFMGRSLMGISLECARCHDHKYDPISQRDYYALLGFFQSSSYAPVPVDASSRREAAMAVERYRSQVAEKARLLGFIRREGLLLNVRGGGRVKQWQASRTEVLAPMYRRLMELEIEVLRAESKAAAKQGDSAAVADLGTAIEQRVNSLENLESPEYGAPQFKEMGYFISGHKSQLGLIKRSQALGREDLVKELREQAEYWQQERDRWGERTRYGGYARTDPEVAELAKAAERINEIQASLPANPDRPWESPKSGHRYVRTDGGLRREEDLGPLDEIARAAGLQFNNDNANRVWMHPWFIGNARLLKRGDVLEPGDLVPRGFPVFFQQTGELASSATALEIPPDRSGRLELAHWLTREDSLQAALVARAAVNRLWQQLFGDAICRTPKELGRLGETPDMPELIDHLAGRLVEQNWSIKSLVREIVLSEAYQRSASVAETDLALDPDNRFFARQNVRRLEFEAIGNLVEWLGRGQRHAGPTRASEYAEHFDAPSPYDLVESRVVSITPTQALFMMNDERAAQALARSLVTRLGLAGQDALLEAITPLYLAVFQRPPTETDRRFASGYIERRREQFGISDPSAELLEFTSLLICANETIYLQ